MTNTTSANSMANIQTVKHFQNTLNEDKEWRK